MRGFLCCAREAPKRAARANRCWQRSPIVKERQLTGLKRPQNQMAGSGRPSTVSTPMGNLGTAQKPKLTSRKHWPLLAAHAEEIQLIETLLSNGPATLGVMIDGGGASVVMIALRSLRPSGADRLLMRTMRSTRGCVSVLNGGKVSSRPRPCGCGPPHLPCRCRRYPRRRRALSGTDPTATRDPRQQGSVRK